MNYFFDNMVSPRIAIALNELDSENEITYLRKKFQETANDIDWMTALSKEAHWIIITADKCIRRNPHEKAAWKEAGIPIYFLSSRFVKLPFWQQALRMIKIWPKIIEHVKNNRNREMSYSINLNATKIE